MMLFHLGFAKSQVDNSSNSKIIMVVVVREVESVLWCSSMLVSFHERTHDWAGQQYLHIVSSAYL
jgi:hypothetical protein